MERKCFNCGNQLRGRSDQKFCDDGCRGNFNNLRRSVEEQTLKIINTALRKNRKILMTLKPNGNATVNILNLPKCGFDFEYHTYDIIRNGKNFRFCYEFGYALVSEERVKLVIQDQTD